MKRRVQQTHRADHATHRRESISDAQLIVVLHRFRNQCPTSLWQLSLSLTNYRSTCCHEAPKPNKGREGTAPDSAIYFCGRLCVHEVAPKNWNPRSHTLHAAAQNATLSNPPTRNNYQQGIHSRTSNSLAIRLPCDGRATTSLSPWMI